MQDKARQDKTKQDKTRQDKTRRDETRQGETRRGKARQDKRKNLVLIHDFNIYRTLSHCCLLAQFVIFRPKGTTYERKFKSL